MRYLCSIFTQIPQIFFSTCWAENEEVATKALLTWDNVCKVIQHYYSLPKSSQPQTNVSYDTLVRHKDDSFMKVKFLIMKDIAAMLNTYLKLFQTDAPMVPFLSDVLEKLVRSSQNFKKGGI